MLHGVHAQTCVLPLQHTSYAVYLHQPGPVSYPCYRPRGPQCSDALTLARHALGRSWRKIFHMTEVGVMRQTICYESNNFYQYI